MNAAQQAAAADRLRRRLSGRRWAELEKGMIPVDIDDLELAVEFVSSGMPTEHQAYIALDTGAIYWVSESGDIDDDAPEDLGEPDRYLEVPAKTDLGLGRPLAMRFAEERIPNEYERIREFFSHRGANARFKGFLEARGQLDAWYAFEAEHTRRAILDWCEAHAITPAHETARRETHRPESTDPKRVSDGSPLSGEPSRVTMAGTSSEPFRALASSLKECGFTAHAGRLDDTLNGTWTTSSELIAELGGVVLDIRRECSPLTPEQKRLVKDCLRQVRRVWPGFGLLQGMWHRWLS